MMTFGSLLYTFIFSPLGLMFEVIYYFFFHFLANPGLAIIALSLVVNLLVLPLYNRADMMQEAERDMEAKLSRGVSHIKKTFKGDEQLMMLREYYRQNHYSPTDIIKGSVSLFLEIPFFVAAYQFLSHLEILHGVSFGPISDLGAPDGLLTIGGVAIHVLPFVMTAINLIAAYIFTKGFPLKSKIQLYGMALFFLIFLYDSPAGLVFYWTLNNLFNLVKTVINKLPHPKKGMYAALFFMSVLLLVYCCGFMPGRDERTLGKACLIAFLLNIPYLKARLARQKKETGEAGAALIPQTKRFLAESLFLSLFIGGIIPSAVIVSSPQEFVVPGLMENPAVYIASSLALAAGTFILWFGVFYWLGNGPARVAFERRLWVFAGIAVVDYMCFGRGLGLLTATLKYENGMQFSNMEKGINAAAVLIVGFLFFRLWKRYGRYVTEAFLIGSLALGIMLGLNLHTISANISDMPTTHVKKTEQPKFSLSRNGKNVIVLMLDRAMGLYVPYLMREKPELQKQFAGFTYYANTLAYGGHTIFGSPGIFGGYDYIPEEMNRRKDISLREKQNEALRLMPVLFDEAGYAVTVSHVPYPNYNKKPGLGIYDDHPHIRKFWTLSPYKDKTGAEITVSQNFRNFFCFAMVKVSPVFMQNFLYKDGVYNGFGKSKDQIIISSTKAVGLDISFMKDYRELEALPEITEIRNDGDTFLMMVNDTVHSTVLFSVPDYVPTEKVDNTAYEAAHKDRFTAGGMTLRMDTVSQNHQYQCNMAALLLVGKWLDTLRAQGVYDNTRIIIVSDHGSNVHHNDAFELTWGSGDKTDLNCFYPLLMVKDFGETEWKTSETFMTNADVPTLAFSDLISNPVNPATGRAVTTDKKEAPVQYVIASSAFKVDQNQGNTFDAAPWYAVKEDVRKKENWSLAKESAELPE